MPTLSLTKAYADNTGLFEDDLENLREGITAFFNVTKIDSINIKNEGITTSLIADSAITTVKFNDDSVTTPKLADGGVTGDKIGDVTTSNEIYLMHQVFG